MKYKLTGETIVLLGTTLYRIQSLKNFGNVKEGDLGGYVEKMENLSHEGNCWVGEDSKVLDDARVYEDALIEGECFVRDEAKVYGKAHLKELCLVGGNAEISGSCTISGKVRVLENAKIHNSFYVTIKGDLTIAGNANIAAQGVLFCDGSIVEEASISGRVDIRNAIVHIGGKAEIKSRQDFLMISSVGSRGDTLCIYKTSDDELWCGTGCFCGSLEEFQAAVDDHHGWGPDANIHAKTYNKIIKFAKEYFV